MEHILWLNNNKYINNDIVPYPLPKCKKIKKGKRYYCLKSNIDHALPHTTNKQNTILFIGNLNSPIVLISYLNEALSYINNIDNKELKYTLILSITDETIRPDKIINIPDSIKNIYIANINYDHDKIKFMPLGIEHRNKEYRHMMNNDITKQRNILCYCNFSLDTHKDRKTVYSLIRDKNFILRENMGNWATYSISREQFFDRLNNSKFVLCPRGAGIDTHRFYETLYCGAIPIVVKEHFHSIYEDLPILFLDNINEFGLLTEEYLEEMYIKLSLKKKEYYKELDFSNIINNIKTELKII